MRLSLRTTRQQRVFGASRSDDVGACKQAQIQVLVKAKRSDLRNGLTYCQRVFLQPSKIANRLYRRGKPTP